MSRDYVPGTEIYFLDRIDTSTEHTLNESNEIKNTLFTISETLKEILAIQKEAQLSVVSDIAKEQLQAQAKQREELANIFMNVIAITQRPDLLAEFIKSVEKDSLAKLAKTLTCIQDIVYEQTMRDFKEQAMQDGAEASETMDGVTAPFVAILPK